MKNYKHVSKSNNAMKLAAVASAAVMLAPVAMSSVSSFADGYFSMNDSTGQKRVVYYPVYNNFATVANAVPANQNGTNGGSNSSMQQGATTGFDTTDLQNIIDQINALAINPNAGTYKSQKTQLFAQYGKLYDAALKANTDLTSASFPEMSAENQLNLFNSLQDATDQYNTLEKQAVAAYHTYDNADVAATGAKDDSSLAAVANAAAQALKDAMGKFQSFVNLVDQYNTTVGRKTANGSVLDAANAAALAIKNVPAGAQHDAFVTRLSQIQGVYALATKINNVGNGAMVAATPDAAKTIDAAAAKAVADLNDLAGDAFKVAPSSTTVNGQIGSVKINYNKNYGIQIWTAEGKAVRYNAKEAAIYGHKVGDAKKLQGQKNFKVFAVNGKPTVQMNGTTYYNLGGDQYIDAVYTTYTAAN